MADLAGVWRYDTNQVIAAPASGYLRTNPTPVSLIAVSTTTQGAADVSADLMLLTTGASVLIQEVGDATLAAKYQLTAAPINHTSWVELPVAVVAYTPGVGPPRPNEDLLVTGQAATAHAPYTTLAELKRVLQKPAPTADETAAMNRCLNMAGGEIDWELGYNADNPAPTDVISQAILAEVNLERAEELWKQSLTATGTLTVGPDMIPITQPWNTWRRHAIKLQPLKLAEGVA